MNPGRVQEEVKAANLQRAGRRGFPHGREVELCPHGRRCTPPEVHHLQLRRDGAGRLQGPPAHGRKPPPAHRGTHHRRAMPSRLTAPISSSGGNTTAIGQDAWQGHRGGLRARIPGEKHPGHRDTASRCASTRVPAATSAAKRRRCSTPWRGSGASPAPSPPSRSSPASGEGRPS